VVGRLAALLKHEAGALVKLVDERLVLGQERADHRRFVALSSYDGVVIAPEEAIPVWCDGPRAVDDDREDEDLQRRPQQFDEVLILRSVPKGRDDLADPLLVAAKAYLGGLSSEGDGLSGCQVVESDGFERRRVDVFGVANRAGRDDGK
jgi:hypothetical protein